MANQATVCTACFPEGIRPECRVFDESGGALAIYGVLHATGKTPAMCQDEDGRFRVCHQPPAVASPSADRRLLVRAA